MAGTPSAAHPIMLPRERLANVGATALSDSELLALILCTGAHTAEGPVGVRELAESLISRFGDLDSTLNAPRLILEEVSGIGFVKASRLAAAAEISKRVRGRTHGTPIRSVEDACLAFSELATLDREELWIGMLNHRNQLLKKHQVGTGGVDRCSASPRDILRLGVKYDGVRLILAHNHPSGDPMPSADDIQFTEAIYRASRVVGVELLDHLIIGSGNRFFSFSREGFMPISKEHSRASRPFD